MSGTSIEVANEFIRLGNASGRPLTPMQLQKLVYIAHGWCLALTSKALTTDDPQAWDFGPVYSALYERLRQYGRAPVDKEIPTDETVLGWIEDSLGISKALTSEDKQVIEQVFRLYGSYPAFKLSALTHEADTPWSKAYVRNANNPIQQQSIKEHFQQLSANRVAS